MEDLCKQLQDVKRGNNIRLSNLEKCRGAAGGLQVYLLSKEDKE